MKLWPNRAPYSEIFRQICLIFRSGPDAPTSYRTMNLQARRDLFVCLGIWLALEVICFGFLPAVHMDQTRSSLQGWFGMSLLLGIGGAVSMASGRQLADFWRAESQAESQAGSQARWPRAPAKSRSRQRWQQRFQAATVGLVSWLGLFGIGFPLFVISLQISGQLFGLLQA